MATITTGGSGNWSSTTPNAPWPGGTLPTNADDVVIGAASTNLTSISVASPAVFTLNSHGLTNGQIIRLDSSEKMPPPLMKGIDYYVINAATNTFNVSLTSGGTGVNTTASGTGTHAICKTVHTVTVDTTLAVCLTLTVHPGSTLIHSSSASNTLTSQRTITFNTGSCQTCDLSAAPTVVATITLNNQADNTTQYGLDWADGVGPVMIKGSPRKRWTRLNGAIAIGATSAVVDDATGWRPGDTIVFGTTQDYSTTPKIDKVVLDSSYTAGSTTLTWTGAGGSGTIAYAHDDNGPVGNFSSNVIIKSASTAAVGRRGYTRISAASRANGYNYQYHEFSHILFLELGCAYNRFSFDIQNTADRKYYNIKDLSSCAFLDSGQIGLNIFGYNQDVNIITCENNIFYISTVSTTAVNISSAVSSTDFNNFVIFGVTASGGSSFGLGLGASSVRIRDFIISGVRDYAFSAGWPTAYGVLDSCEIYSNGRTMGGSGGGFLNVKNSQIDNSFSSCRSGSLIRGENNPTALFDNCTFASSYLTSKTEYMDRFSSLGVYDLFNINQVPTAHERWMNRSNTVPAFVSNSSTINRSTTSLQANTCGSTYGPISISFSILVTSGKAEKIIGYMRRNSSYGSTARPYVNIKGQGVDVTATLTDVADTWEKFELDFTPTSTGNAEVTFVASGTHADAQSFLSGVPFYPWIQKVRHYGYLFDETTVTRTVNPIVVASELTAAAYTGVTIDSTTPKLTIATGTANTYQKVYDYIQAWACLNVDKTVLFTSTDGINFNVPLTCKVDWAGMSNDGTLAGGWLLLTEGTYALRLSGTKIDFTEAGSYNMSGTVFSGTVELVNSSAGSVTVSVPAGISYTNTGPNIMVTEPVEGYGLSFSNLVSGSTVRIFETGTTTVIDSVSSSGTTFQWDTTGSGETVDYTILKDGYLPIRVTGIALTDSILPVQVQQVTDRAYVASSGLSFGTTATATVGTSRFGLSTASTLQNFYSFMIESWRTESSLANVAFPILANGPNSFTLVDWEFSSGSIPYLYRDGLRYYASGQATAIWAAILSVGTSAGMQVRYQQSDGGTTVEASATGPIDELVQIYGDSSHGNFDRRDYLKLKVQADGYDEATTDAIATYGNLEDQLYIVGLAPLSNGLTTGDPSVTGVTITDHGGSPVTWNSKAFSITITDSGTNSGEDIMRWLRYNFEAGGTFQGKDAFNWHDLVLVNGDKFKTIRGPVYGDTGATLKGVRVLRGTDPHPDFDLMTADDGTTYAPPPVASVTISGAVVGSRIQLYDLTADEELLNSTSVFTWSEIYSADRQIRLRVMYTGAATASIFIDTIIGTITETSPTISYLVDQSEDEVYATNGVDGSGVTGITIDDDNLLISIDDTSISWGEIYAYETYWLSTEEGIRDEGRIIDAVDVANYTFYGFKIKNVGTSSLKITGGYAVDSETNSIEDLIDTSGNSIFPLPDHVVAYNGGGAGGDPWESDLSEYEDGTAGHAVNNLYNRKVFLPRRRY